MDTRRLYSFIKIVDTGSLTRAADILHIAQPALSQQISALEAQFKQRLLIRSKRGVVPTEAGRALYRHAQLILRQLEQAQADISSSASVLAGNVSVGLAPYSTATALALPLLTAVRDRYPEILLHMNENFGGVISEMVMTGKMDFALIYDAGPIRGVRFEPLLIEDLFLVAPPGIPLEGTEDADVPLRAIANLDLLVPSRIHTIRKVVEASFRRMSLAPRIIAEIESVPTMASAITAGLGATILPWSAASAFAGVERLTLHHIAKPRIEVKVSLCVSDSLPLSDPAIAVREILFGLVQAFADSHQTRGVRRAAHGTQQPSAATEADRSSKQRVSRRPR